VDRVDGKPNNEATQKTMMSLPHFYMCQVVTSGGIFTKAVLSSHRFDCSSGLTAELRNNIDKFFLFVNEN